MLQDIRERAQGWIAWFIVILISVPFALWGIQEYLGVGSEPVMATVNGQEITDRDFDFAYRQFRERLRQQLGDNYRPELIDEAALRKEVLDSMIRDQVIVQAAADMGLGAGDELLRATIRSIPSFQVGGSFNKQAYEAGVRTRGLSTAGFEAQLRQSLMSEQLGNAVRGSAFVTDAEVEEFVRLRMQRRDLSHLVIPAADYAAGVQLDEAALRAHYEANRNAFMAPERVKVEYIELAIETIADTLEADEASLLGYYEQNRNAYLAPEQRRASHILIALDEGSDAAAEEAARVALEQVVDRLRAGESFATLAQELSQDPGSADLGGDLDYFERGVMDPAFEEAVFSLQPDEVSAPVRSDFGYHLIKLTDIRPASGKAFDEIREEIRKAYLKTEAERRFYEYAERLSDLAYEDPNSLQPASEALGLPVQTSDWLTRDGADGIFASTRLVGSAFSDDVLLGGNNSEAVEIGAEHIAVLRVVEHEERSVRPFDSVTGEIESLLRSQRAAELAREEGERLLQLVSQDGNRDAVASELGKVWSANSGVTRDNRELPPALIDELFRMSRPAAGEHVYSGAVLAGGDYALIALERVVDGTLDDAESIGGVAAIRQALSASRGEAYYRHLVDNLKAKADIQITRRDDE